MGFLYRITGPSGKCYIGITSGGVDERWRFHRSHANSRCVALTAALRKYGSDKFMVETLVEADWSYLVELEKRAIKKFGTKAPNGYNLTDGGDGTPGYNHTPEAIERIRAHARERRLSDAHRQRIGDTLRGRKRPVHAAKLRGRTRPEHAQFMRDLWAKRKREA